MKKLLFFLLIFIYNSDVFGQELIHPLEYNPVIKKYIKENDVASKVAGVNDTLALPFVDDFSSTKVYPDANKWTDNKVFINSTSARVMPTIGVATFDGLDELGNAYVPGSANSGSCDALTSKPIYLHTNTQGGFYSVGDSITLSFYFEKKGYGDAPEATDSLVLEFYRPSLQTWTKVWYSPGGVTGGQDTIFTLVNVLVDGIYLEDGFQFRFRNYGNLSGSLDNWHVDYVRIYVGVGGSSVSVIDQAFTSPRTSDLETFTSIPWKHYKNAADQNALMKDNSSILYTIYQSPGNVNSGFKHNAYAPDLSTVGQFTGGIFGVPSNTRLAYSYGLNYVYPNASQLNDDSSYFDIADHFLQQQGGDNIFSNDTIHYRQYFYNYYSYDDGSCELGYDLFNAANGKIAMKFDMLQADTLRGVQMFFTLQNADVSNKLITIKVWSSLSPEVVLYQMTNQFPAYIDSINGFATYVFPTPVPASSFYIGFQQVAPDGLHLGFDRNTSSNSKMYYNTSGSWSFVSVLPGSFMIRPLVGSVPLTSVKENNISEVKIQCYPNPTSGFVNIYNASLGNTFTSVVVSDIQGRAVITESFRNGSYDFSALTSGIYMITLTGDGISSAPVKLFINH